ncbi:MAG: YgjV family protein, partial [Clostridia bacterium]|nr:YgjV family protein [Clostridia bacterium]
AITNAAIIVIGILLYDTVFSLLAIAGVLCESVSGWMKNEKLIRIVSLFGVPCWLVYNVAYKAYGSVIGSVLALISIITALIRYSRVKESDIDEAPTCEGDACR